MSEADKKEEIKASHFKTMEELLEHLKMWEEDEDYYAYCRFFDDECAYALAHKINKLQKELDKKDKVINLIAQDRAEISEPKVSKEAIIDFYFKKVEEEND